VIRNFDINIFNQKTPIHFRNFSQINYLVGENGSGKSLVLWQIWEKHRNSFYIKDCDHRNLERLGVLDNISKIYLEEDQYQEMLKILPEIRDFYASSGPERTGFDKLIKICKLIFQVNSNQVLETRNTSIFLVEEPETHLHPSLQKLIPLLFQKLAVGLKIQIFIETHSPFIVSKAGNMVQASEDAFDKKSHRFEPLQKVYFLRNGFLADKNGKVNGKGEFGYWGTKVTLIAAKMLGVGLGDFIRPLESEISRDSPVLVFCEGQGKDQDAKIYNIIFQGYYPRLMFVSSRGSSQLESSFQVISEVKSGLSANFHILLLRDRDHEFSNEEEILDYQKIHKGSRVLRRRAMECYLYNSETLEMVYQSQNQQPATSDMVTLDNLNQQIQNEAQNGFLGSDYKYRLRNEFMKSIKRLNLPEDFYFDSMENIAKLVTPESTVYKDLEIVLGV